LVGKGAICLATEKVAERQAAAIGQVVRASATVVTEAGQIAQEAVAPRAAVEVAETGMRLEAAPEDTTDQLHAPTATAAPRAWDLEVGVEVEAEAARVAVVAAVAVAGAGKQRT
jgi:hypothetical protein